MTLRMVAGCCLGAGLAAQAVAEPVDAVMQFEIAAQLMAKCYQLGTIDGYVWDGIAFVDGLYAARDICLSAPVDAPPAYHVTSGGMDGYRAFMAQTGIWPYAFTQPDGLYDYASKPSDADQGAQHCAVLRDLVASDTGLSQALVCLRDTMGLPPL